MLSHWQHHHRQRTCWLLVAVLSGLVHLTRVGSEGAGAFFSRNYSTGYQLNVKDIFKHCEYQKPYSKGYKGAQHCLKYLGDPNNSVFVPVPNGEAKLPEKLILHAYWRGPLRAVMQLSLKSFLFSQVPYGKPHIQPAQLWLWLDDLGELPEGIDPNDIPFDYVNQHYGPVHPALNCPQLIKFRAWYTRLLVDLLPEELFPEQLIEQDRSKLRSMLNKLDISVKAKSDLVRFTVLHHYGGLYVDTDVLLMRDLRPLQHHEFAYRWEVQYYCNTAVLGSPAGSKYTGDAIKKALKKAFRSETNTLHAGELGAAFHPKRVCFFPMSTMEPMVVFPCQLFNLQWLQIVKFPKAVEVDKEWHFAKAEHFLSRESAEAERGDVHNFNFGAFANHWHNGYHAEIKERTWAHVHDHAYEQFFRGERANMYGERFDAAACGAGANGAISSGSPGLGRHHNPLNDELRNMVAGEDDDSEEEDYGTNEAEAEAEAEPQGSASKGEGGKHHRMRLLHQQRRHHRRRLQRDS